MPKANAQRLTILAELRLAAGLTLSDMAHRCGLRGNQSHQSAGAWERGEMIPNDGRRRTHFLGYLWDDLGLRRDPAQFEKVWDILVEEWLWEPMNDREWAGLTSRPRAKAETTPAPVLTVGSLAPFQAPALVGHFVGRETTLTQLTTLLTAPSGARTVALVGMGGIGKSTLAIHTAHALREHFVDGVLWANLATAHPLQVLQVWALALGYDFSGITDLESRAAALRGVLANRQILLVLDDVRNADVVRPLLPGTVACGVLMTMRDQDIAVVLNAQLLPLRELRQADGLHLLTQLAGAERIATDRGAAQTICSILDGYPLAIEIIGKLLARNHWQPLAETVNRLQDATKRLDQLKLKDLSVRASFEVSWQVLSVELRERFATLGVFAGRTFALPAAAALSSVGKAADADEIATLVALSLLNAEGDGYFRQHPLLADFAREQMTDAATIYNRFSAYYLSFCQAPTTQDQQLAHELSNLMAALTAAHQLGEWTTVIDYALTLADPWLRCAWYTEARQGYALAVAAAKQLNQPMALATLLVNWGMVCSDQGDFVEAEQHLTAAATLATTHALPTTLAAAQFHLTRIALERGDYEEADELLTACQQGRQALQDRAGIARVLHQRAILVYRHGDYGQAKRLGDEALAIQQTEQDTLGLLLTLRLLADVAISERDFITAQQLCLRALPLATTTTYRSELAETYYSLATIHRFLNETEEAWHYAEEAYHQFVRIGNRWFQAYTLYEQSKIKQLAGELPVALALALKSLDLLTDLADTYNRVNCLLLLGDLYQQIDQSPEAARLWREGMALAQSIRHPKIDEFQKRLGDLE